jgi:hypothetical protein
LSSSQAHDAAKKNAQKKSRASSPCRNSESDIRFTIILSRFRIDIEDRVIGWMEDKVANGFLYKKMSYDAAGMSFE